MVLVSVTTSALASNAQDAKNEISTLWNIDQMMRQAAANIARRYNLNEHQTELTRKLLVDEVTQFLDEHEDIWPLIRDLTRQQMAGRAPDGDVAKRIGQAALPLLAEVQNAIMNANTRWRGILNEDQKKMHDWDLRDMNKTFSKMQERFQKMAEGQADNQGPFPAPNQDEPQPRQPRKPKADFKPAMGGEAHVEKADTDAWLKYVQDFVARHDLDNAQSESAFSVLRECQKRADDYLASKERDFARVRKQLTDVVKSDSSPEVKKHKLRVWKQIEKRMEKPVHDIFQELKDRLDRIPTDSQKARAEGKKNSRNVPRRGKRTTPKDQAGDKPLRSPEPAENDKPQE